MARSLNTNTHDKDYFDTFIGPQLAYWKRWFVTALILLVMPMFSLAEDTALVLTAPGDAFKEVISGITGDLEEELNFEIYVISKGSKVSEVEQQISKHKPKIIILVENNAINLYAKYQKAHPKAEFPPSVAVAALFVDRFISKLKNATGIRYEIPAVTSIVNMRTVLQKPVKRVGVIHRKWMRGLIDDNNKYCLAEGIELVSIEIPNKDKKLDKKLKSGLKSLLNKKIDALWVLNDNALLNANMIRSAWLPVIGNAKLPVIVGIKPMLSTQLNFGSFAIVPDHYALGVQAASIIGEIMEEDWYIGEREIEQPVSVKKIVNISVLDNKKVQYKQNEMQNMDEVVQ
ncbi:MAG: hypothetical protein ACI9FJ_001530 [Alteromonadaceae bacterium]|jgi:hypothetical protein